MRCQQTGFAGSPPPLVRGTRIAYGSGAIANGVVGYNDIPLPHIFEPPLTTIRAGSLLVEERRQIEGGARASFARLRVPLVIRES